MAERLRIFMTDLELKIIETKKQIRACKSEKRRRDLEKHLKKLLNANNVEHKKGVKSWAEDD